MGVSEKNFIIAIDVFLITAMIHLTALLLALLAFCPQETSMILFKYYLLDSKDMMPFSGVMTLAMSFSIVSGIVLWLEHGR